MNGKEILIAAIAANTVLLAFAASLRHHLPGQLHARAGGNDVTKTGLTGPSGKFGSVIETVLPPAKAEGVASLLDLETGRTLVYPSLESFNSRADAMMAWPRSNGLDLSCNVWPGGANCVTYDMTVVPVQRKCWEEMSEQELLGNPALAAVPHSPRRLIVLGHGHPDTYVFRTGEGTLGMLRIVGLNEGESGVKIRYKLINPGKSIAAGKASGSEQGIYNSRHELH